jgi:hypothetical protein
LKRKREPDPVVQTQFNDMDKIYFYVRRHTLIYPIPYKWKLDFNKMEKIKALTRKAFK